MVFTAEEMEKFRRDAARGESVPYNKTSEENVPLPEDRVFLLVPPL
jgi:hypothetical protein